MKDRSRQLFCVLLVLTALVVFPGMPALSEPVISSFDTGLEGWNVFSVPVGGPYDSIVSGPHIPNYDSCHLTQKDLYTGYFTFWQAPAKFLGDQSDAYGHQLTFRLKQGASDGNALSDADVVMVGGGTILVIDAGANPAKTWTDYSVTLDEASGWHVGKLSGAAPTHDEFMAVISDLTAMRIRGEFWSGTGDVCALDDIAIHSDVPVVSDFEADLEDWAVVDIRTGGPYDTLRADPYPATRKADGNPGGYAHYFEPSMGGDGLWMWNAPPAFLGNKLGAYGRSLSFDLWQMSANGSALAEAGVALIAPGRVLVADIGANPATTWTSYSIPLVETAGWHLKNLRGEAPTRAEFRSVLSSLTGLKIRGEYITGDDRCGIDNVVLNAGDCVATAKLKGDGAEVDIDLAVVSACFGDDFYMQDEERECGVLVHMPGHGVTAGARVHVLGVMDTLPSGERCVVASSAEPAGSAQAAPINIRCAAIGGGFWNYDPASGAGQLGVSGGIGVNNIGLLMRIAGEVVDQEDSANPSWFTVQDGSGYPVRVVVGAGVNAPGIGEFAGVTGISSCEINGSDILPILRVREQTDITPY